VRNRSGAPCPGAIPALGLTTLLFSERALETLASYRVRMKPVVYALGGFEEPSASGRTPLVWPETLFSEALSTGSAPEAASRAGERMEGFELF